MKWHTVSRSTLYQGFFKLEAIDLQHELFGGGMTPSLRRELLHRHHAVAVLPYDPLRDEVVLIEQFRIGPAANGTEPWLMEVIAGYREPGESCEQVIHREAMEEAGCEISDLLPIQRYYASPGSSTEEIRIYTARTDTTHLGGIHGLEHEGEDIRVNVISSDAAFELLDQGRIGSAIPIIALQWLRMNIDSLRERWL